MKNLFNQFENLKGASFVGLNGYESKTSGEVSNVVICTNLSVETAKQKDLNTLLNCNESDLLGVSNSSNLPLDVCKIALAELIASAQKNLSENLEERSNQSQGQTDAFVNLGNGLKLHKETLALHIFGISISKTVLCEGTYKSVNSSQKTLAKKAITKFLDLRAGKFRTFIVTNCECVNVSGQHIEI